ncbi:MAG: U32 family peptidase, partial [Lentisphaerae bacterium]|nr:U32 family peptidase [Lentisphaerota bacterium]
MELLAPAKNLEAGIAAFHYGADAVYLGMHDFSARADADNFSLDDLAVLIGIAHNNQEWRRKVYVTINTLVQEQELPGLITLLAQLRDLEVDALIIQDLALLAIVKEHFP